MLVALSAVLTLESFRVLFPVMYGQADTKGNEAAAAMVSAVFAAGFLAPAARRLLGPRPALAASVGALAVWRLAIPLFGHVPLALAVFGAVAALLATTLALTDEMPSGAEVTGLALLAGLGLDVAIRASFATWDPVWQSGPFALAVGAVLAAALGIALVGLLRSGEPGPRPAAVTTVGGGVAVGALLALEILFLLSPGFVGSSAAISLPWSALVVLAGIALAVGAFVATGQVRSRGVAIAAGVALAGVGFLLPTVAGWTVVAAVLAAQVATGAALAAAFAPAAPSSRLRGELGLATGWLVLAMTVLLYQVHFDKPLPFGNRWVIATTGALAALAAFRPRRPAGPAAPPPPVRHAALAAAALLVVGVCVAAGLATTGIGDTAAPAAGAPLRVVEWNIRQAVTTGTGNLDPEEVASVLSQGGRPDIVVLPEAARGWTLSGDLDLGAWLSRRLDLPFVWGPAADNQFGTLVLSRLPIIEANVDDLPVDGRAQGRSVVRAELEVAGGEPLTLLATHLQHRNDDSAMEARLREIDQIIGEWNGARRTLLVGDLNPRQGDPPDYPPRRPGDFAEIRALLDAGFTTAHNLVACSEPTSGRNCTDFVLVSPDLHQEVSVPAEEGAFDHRPVVSTVRTE